MFKTLTTLIRGAAAKAEQDLADRHALLILEQRLQQVLGSDPLVRHSDRDGLRRLEEALGAIGKFLEVHVVPL